MPDVVADGLEGHPDVDQTLDASVTEGVRSWSWYGDSRGAEVPLRAMADHRDRRGDKGRRRTDEHLSVTAARPRALEVGGDRLADGIGDWIRGRVPGLPRRNPQPSLAPIDVIERQPRDLAGTKAVRDQEKQDRVIALAERAATIDGRQDTADVGPGDRPRQSGVSIDERPLHGAADVHVDHALAMHEPKQRPQSRDEAQHAGGRKGLRALGHEGREDERSDVAQVSKPDPCEVPLERPEIVGVVTQRLRTQPPLIAKEGEEPGHLAQQRQRHARASRADEPGHREPEHLLHRDPGGVADPAQLDLARVAAVSAARYSLRRSSTSRRKVARAVASLMAAAQE